MTETETQASTGPIEETTLSQASWAIQEIDGVQRVRTNGACNNFSTIQKAMHVRGRDITLADAANIAGIMSDVGMVQIDVDISSSGTVGIHGFRDIPTCRPDGLNVELNDKR